MKLAHFACAFGGQFVKRGMYGSGIEKVLGVCKRMQMLASEQIKVAFRSPRGTHIIVWRILKLLHVQYISDWWLLFPLFFGFQPNSFHSLEMLLIICSRLNYWHHPNIKDKKLCNEIEKHGQRCHNEASHCETFGADWLWTGWLWTGCFVTLSSLLDANC